jgi:transposase InsO family protein
MSQNQFAPLSGKPVENGFIESFNGKLRDECLNTEIFFTLEDARQKLAHWRKDYNEQRPHSALGGLPPMEHLWHIVEKLKRTAAEQVSLLPSVQ